MPQQTCTISPIMLTHYRDKANFTQQQLADKVHLSLRQYQRIEKGGLTSPQTLKRLASIFAVTTETLSKLPDHVESEWFIIDPNGNGSLEKSYLKALDEIKACADKIFSLYPENCHVEIHFDNSDPSCKKITVRYPLDDTNFVWKFYAARFSQETGIFSHSR
ncbi:helix-turn-helix domain-containing protein [uncultured Endozoicomonas sp.]|uniref:helix-turn-helix domain-containing protein n=1 Tax=uncultured Endozoicomonas sp. TaxID=432652 RepID=UPI0026034725|nr:helix-turn-helix domain-containing protein [uncultured Endozoicomonas sp.]